MAVEYCKHCESLHEMWGCEASQPSISKVAISIVGIVIAILIALGVSSYIYAYGEIIKQEDRLYGLQVIEQHKVAKIAKNRHETPRFVIISHELANSEQKDTLNPQSASSAPVQKTLQVEGGIYHGEHNDGR